MKNETPIRRQYLEIKANHKDAILLFRLGDFYEAFDEDARLLARELDIVLTSKPMGKNMRVPLAGIPYHSLEKHLVTLISRGHRVAICEQTSSVPVKNETGKGLINRQVVRTVTAGTVIEPSLLDSKSNNYLVSFFSDGQRAGIAYADITTGDFAATEIENKDALNELQRLSPAEIIIAETQETFSNRDLPQFVTKLNAQIFEFKDARKILSKHFHAKSLQPFGLEKLPLAVSAAGALIAYLNITQGDAAEQLTRLTSYDFSEFMLLDNNTLRSLEIFESSSGASLLSLIDRTKTAMGGRLLRKWLRQPLLDCAEIFRRQEHIAWFEGNAEMRETVREILADIKDLERLSSRAKANYISAYELRAFGVSLELIPKIKNILRKDTVRFGQILTHLPECLETAKLIESGISAELPIRQTDQVGIIRAGFSAELDKLRQTLRDGKGFLAEMEKRERERTGIKSLRVGFNKVFGYYIEITKPNLHLVPSDYTRKQTLLPAERYITLELKEHESLVIHAQERIAELENSLFRQICAEVGKNRPEILLTASTIAYLDAICSLADVADTNNYSRPTVNETSLLRIKNGRHAVIESRVESRESRVKNQELRVESQPDFLSTLDSRLSTVFIPNDAALGGNGAPQIALITGPNASGKCLSGDTIVFTEKGMVSLKELRPKKVEVKQFTPLNRVVKGISGRKLASHFYYGGKQKTIKITTRLGYDIEGTPEHRVWVRDSSGSEMWKLFGDLREGDYIAIERNLDIWGNQINITALSAVSMKNVKRYELPHKLTKDLSYLIGLLTGDGTMTYELSFQFTTADEYLAEEFRRIILKLFGYRVGCKANKMDYFVSSKQIRAFLHDVGMDFCQSHQKRVPILIRCAPKPMVIAFLQGLFDADGHADKRHGNIEYSTASPYLASEIQMILLNLGIISSRHEKPTKARLSYRISISGADAIKFHRVVGFKLPRKSERKFLAAKLRRPNVGGIPFLNDTLKQIQAGLVAKVNKPFALKKNKSVNSIFYTYIPNGRNVSYRKLSELINFCNLNEVSCEKLQNIYDKQYLYEPIVKIEQGRNEVYDLSVDDDHAYIANGFVSHNSTYLRQIALIVLLAQIGSFVPADEALIGICDRIFTRIGLYDRIGAGESTFMTEMIETAEILHNASPNSLILLDELGRGTSTYDGLAVARSVLEFIHNHPKLKTRTLFATHYHELAELEELLPRLENFFFVIEEKDALLTFKYKLEKGTALKSYGVYVAKLAGLPKPVVRRAEQLLNTYDQEHIGKTASNLLSSKTNEIERKLSEIDTDALSPVEALMKLYELKALLKDVPESKRMAS